MRWGSCSRLRMKTLEQCQCHRFSVFIVNREYISNLVLIVDFEQKNVCWLYTEKTNTFKDRIGYIMRYVIVF